MTDKYTQAVLTVIAVALVTLVIQQGSLPATAQSSCGAITKPCAMFPVMNYQEQAVPCASHLDRACFSVGTLASRP